MIQQRFFLGHLLAVLLSGILSTSAIPHQPYLQHYDSLHPSLHHQDNPLSSLHKRDLHPSLHLDNPHHSIKDIPHPSLSPSSREGNGGDFVVVRDPETHHHYPHLSHWTNKTPTTHQDPTNSLAQRDDKFIFTVIQFPNDLCGSGLNSGTCVTATECALNGGSKIDTCAREYGICCQAKMAGCGGTITQNNTIITNTEYSTTFNEARSCTYQVEFDDTTNEICQIRYDFIDFDFSNPTTLGVCSADKLVFNNDFKSEYFCGKAPTDYHWYVETAGTTSPHSFTITTDSSSYARKYAIRVSMIPCMTEVPAGCGQYYTGTSGTTSSFNFGNGNYLAGLSYSVCFQKEKNYCTYTLEKTTGNNFIGHPDNVDGLRLMMGSSIAMVANPASAAAGAALCPTLGNQALFNSLPFCSYPPSMTSTNREAAFFITVKTEIDDTANSNPLDTAQSGFEFNWSTNAC